MAEAEKTELKLLVADKILEEINEAAANAEKNRIAANASLDTVNRLLEHFKPYQKRIFTALEDGTFPASSKDATLAVYADMVMMTDKVGKAATAAFAEMGPFAAGLRKAATIIEDFKKKTAAKDAQRAGEEAEEDEYRRGIVEEPPPPPPVEQSTPNSELLPPEAPPAEPPPVAEVPPAVEESPALVENPPEVPIDPTVIPAEAAPEAKAICPHCGDIIEVETGSTLCFACISYKNKHNRLPSQATLRKRRGV
jgi:hypothetical protein